MKLLAIARSPILLVALVVVTAAGAAGAATLRVGINGGASTAPVLGTACTPNCTLDLYVDLEDASVDPADRVASVFQADFDVLVTGSWSMSLDLSEVDPGVDPIDVGTWPSAVGNLSSTRVSVSLTSENLGGERLVLQLHLEPTDTQPTDWFQLFLSSDPDRIIVARDGTGGVAPVPLTGPEPGSLLVVLPEPAGPTMLIAGTAGLMALAALRRRRRA
jgi:hypothetical protein